MRSRRAAAARHAARARHLAGLQTHRLFRHGKRRGLGASSQPRRCGPATGISSSSTPAGGRADRHRRAMPVLPPGCGQQRFHVHHRQNAGLSAVSPLFLSGLLSIFWRSACCWPPTPITGSATPPMKSSGRRVRASRRPQHLQSSLVCTLTKRRRETRSTISKVVNLSLLAAMLSLLITSVIISQTVFSFLPFATSFTARQVHTAGGLRRTAYCCPASRPAVVDDHGPGANRLGLEINTRLHVWVLRGLAFASLPMVPKAYVVDVVSKLSMQVPTGIEAFRIQPRRQWHSIVPLSVWEFIFRTML